MEGELTIGSVGISVILTIFLRLIYGTLNIPKKLKPWIAIFAGIGLSVLVLWLQGNSITRMLAATYIVQGFMVGSTAVGLNELMKKKE